MEQTAETDEARFSLDDLARRGRLGAGRGHLPDPEACLPLAGRLCSASDQTGLSKTGRYPGLGIVLTLVLIWLTGLLASNVLGRRLIGIGNSLLTRLPIIGSIYGPVKQFTETLVSTEKDRGFRRVVLAEYPSRGLWILGFVTGEVRFEDGKMGRCVFVPTSPNPATGWMVICPSEKVRDTRLTVEEAMQLIVSGGLVVPPSLGTLGEFSVREDAVPSLVDLEKNSE